VNKLKELMEKKALIEAESKVLIAKENATAEEINAKLTELKALNAKIEAQKQIDEAEKAQAAAEAAAKKPVNEPLYAQPADHNQKKWKGGMGEFLQAVAQASKPGGNFDNRLTLQNSASGANENIGSEGGFLLDGSFIQELMDTMGAEVQVRNRIRMLPLTSANKLIIPGPDESSRAKGSRWGGVQVYHANEADTVGSTKPKFREFELKLEKLMALCYATDEMLADASVLQTVVKQAYADEMSFQLDDDLINGNGVGQALGILNSPALVSQAKETGQAAGTIVPANINKMWVRMPVRYKKNAVWFINQEVDTALTEMAFGTGANMHPLSLEYLQKGTLKGAPVVPIEQASALGAKGDIILCDPTQYIGIDKNAPSADVSIHVRFLYDESLFRFIYRFNGAPYRNKSITPYKGTLQLSPFVTLDDRK
jgi:HK97 family phage major capsid protein